MGQAGHDFPSAFRQMAAVPWDPAPSPQLNGSSPPLTQAEER